jgi:hypothetical protein
MKKDKLTTYKSMNIDKELAISSVIHIIVTTKELNEFAKNANEDDILFLKTGENPLAAIITKDEFRSELTKQQLKESVEILKNTTGKITIYHIESNNEPLFFKVDKSELSD